jgi:hypothetical protein
MISKIIKYINILFHIYFTTLPNYIYNYATCTGNLGIAGIGLELIYCQKIFWISNVFLLLIIYKYNIYILLFCIYLYILSLHKFYHYINFIIILI